MTFQRPSLFKSAFLIKSNRNVSYMHRCVTDVDGGGGGARCLIVHGRGAAGGEM